LTDTPKQFQRILISGADSFKEFPHYEEWILTCVESDQFGSFDLNK